MVPCLITHPSRLWMCLFSLSSSLHSHYRNSNLALHSVYFLVKHQTLRTIFVLILPLFVLIFLDMFYLMDWFFPFSPSSTVFSSLPIASTTNTRPSNLLFFHANTSYFNFNSRSCPFACCSYLTCSHLFISSTSSFLFYP